MATQGYTSCDKSSLHLLHYTRAATACLINSVKTKLRLFFNIVFSINCVIEVFHCGVEIISSVV